MKTFRVTGGGRFPFSMLRFDNCWPYSDEDAAKLEPEAHERRTVTLQTDNRWAPTGKRWASFNWKLEEQNT